MNEIQKTALRSNNRSRGCFVLKKSSITTLSLELKDKYYHDNGRNAVPPIRMFKYLLLKSIIDLSGVDVVERSKYDMSSFKIWIHLLYPKAVFQGEMPKLNLDASHNLISQDLFSVQYY